MTRNLIVIFFLSLSYSFNINNNSLFSFSKSAKVTSLGSIHFISNDISGVFFQPISNKRNIKKDYYFSFINQYDIKSNILQFAYCIDHDEHKNISFGIIKRNINNLYNTSSSWDSNNPILNLEDIQYGNISKLSYEEFSLIFSYSRYLENSIFNIKVKPIYHRIDSNRAFGINIDLISNYQLNNINILFGLNNIFSYKKWDSDLSEKSEIEYFSSMSFQLEKINIYFELSNLIKKKIAIECKINKNMFLRSGYNSKKRLSYGIGIDLNSIDFNYSNLDLGLLGDSHQISIIIKLDN